MKQINQLAKLSYHLTQGTFFKSAELKTTKRRPLFQNFT
jgi:hypothetical protein